MRRAFILARPRDYRMAAACADHLAATGWRAVIVVDPSEWETCPPGTVQAPYAPEGRMVGNACHEAILSAMIENSEPGDVLLKTDCDTRIEPSASAWLSGAETSARTIMFGGLMWGGLWAAPMSQVARVSAAAPAIPRCRCPESHLAICGLRRYGGIETHPELAVAAWSPSRPWPAAAGAVTLPRKCPAPGRAECGRLLFDFRP